jgi:hypothetical protein
MNRKWLSDPSVPPARRARKRVFGAPLRLEALEDRATPAAVSWDGGGDGTNWTDPRNWAGDVLPGPADDVAISAGSSTTVRYSDGTTTVHSLTSANPLIVSAGTLVVTGPATVTNTLTVAGATLTLNGPSEVQSLTQTGGTLNGSGDLTIDGAWTWTVGGTMTGAGRTILNGTATLGGGFFSKIDGRTVNNAGTATVAAGQTFTFANAAVWNNLAGSTFTLPDSSGVANFFANSSAFNNAGTVVKSGPPGTTTIAVPFNNTGTTQVHAGTLSLTGGGSDSGTFALDLGTTLNVGGPYTFQAGGTETGAGTVQVPTFNTLTVAGDASISKLLVNGGMVTANAGATLMVDSLTFSSGTVAGPGAVTVNGNLNWTNGIMTGPGTTNLNGTAALPGGGIFSRVDGRTVNNAGTASVTIGGSFMLANGAVWNNLAGSLFVLPDSAQVTAFGSPAAFNNAGTVRKDVPPGNTTIGVPFNNTGSVEVKSGALNLTGGGTSSGTFALTDPSSVLNIGGAYTFAGGSETGVGFVQVPTFGSLTVAADTSAAKVQVSGGTLTTAAGATFQVGALNLSGTVTGPGALAVSGPLVWVGGSMTGGGVTNLTGTATISGGFFTKLDGRTVNNAGTATVTIANSFTIAGTGVWNNLPGSAFLLQDSARVDAFFPTSAAFNNAGAIRTDFVPGTPAIAVPVNNTGTVEATFGVFQFTGGYVQTAGRTTVAAGATLAVPGPVGAQILGGELTGGGTVQGSVGNGGAVRPGSSQGVLTIFGNYTQTATGVLAVEIGGLAPGAGYDRLFVTGLTTLDGTLAVQAVNGFLPNFGDTFDVVIPGPRVGQFAAYTGLDLGTYRLLVPQYGPNFVRLLTVSSNQAPALDPIPDQTVDEGSLLTFTTTATGPEPAETITYSLDPGAPAGAAIDPSTGAFTFAPDDGPASYTVTVRATDNGLPALSSTRTFTITVNNVAPTPAIAGAPTTSPEGTAITLTATATDPSAADTAAGFTYAWSVTKDGSPFATGSGADFAFTPDDDGTYVVTLRATDKDGGVGSTTATVTVFNVAPTASLTGPADGVRGQTLTYAGTFTDPGTADTHTLTWAVTKDGAPYAAGSGPAFSFVPTGAGTYTVTFTVTDDDGGVGTASLDVAVSVAAVQPDPLNPGRSLLMAGGTTGPDDIQITQDGSGRLTVTIGGVAVGTFAAPAGAPFSGLVVYAQAGDDDVQVAGSITLPAWLYGGDGNDRLKGGSGNNVLIGGDGDDLLVGGSGRDIIIGGRGADRIVGNAEDDILIGGVTAYDADRAALALLQGTWVRTDLSYEERIASLLDATQRGGVYLGHGTVFNDADADVLTGSAGQDWFWFDATRDRVTDLHDEAFQNDLGFIGP